MSEFFANSDFKFDVNPIKTEAYCLRIGAKYVISGVFPLFEIQITTSSGLTRPKSP